MADLPSSLPATLPTAAWRDTAKLRQMLAVLDPAGDAARFVGGAVRDTLLGLPVSDIDIATTSRPEVVMDRLKSAGFTVVPTGIAHGTVTAVLKGRPVEITSLRRDVSTDGRRATVAFSDDWREDAARRDFTINALYADPATGEIFDYFGGLDDLRTGQLRFIGSAQQRIREDHLRILRYFRFRARFGDGAADGDAEAAIVALAPTLKGISRERVAMELLAMLALPDPAATFTDMARLGVLAVVLPEASIAPLAALVVAEAKAGVRASAMRRMAALLPPDPAIAEKVAARLRLSNAHKQRLMLAADRQGRIADPFAAAYRMGLEGAVDQLLLHGQDIAALAGWQRPEFPLKGGEIVKRGVAAGPAVAAILQAVERRWIAEGFPDRHRVQALLAAEIAAR